MSNFQCQPSHASIPSRNVATSSLKATREHTSFACTNNLRLFCYRSILEFINVFLAGFGRCGLIWAVFLEVLDSCLREV